MKEELLNVFKICCEEKGVTGHLRMEDGEYTITLEATEANHHAERLFYDAILNYAIPTDYTSIQFLARPDGCLSVAFDAFELKADPNATMKLRLLKPSTDLLETLLDYARRMGHWDIQADTEKVFKGQTNTRMLCFSLDQKDFNKTLTVSVSEKDEIRNYVIERAEEGVYLSIPYDWNEFEKKVKEHQCLPFCDVLRLDITNLSFKKGILPSAKRPLVIKQDANKGGLNEVFVIGGRS